MAGGLRRDARGQKERVVGARGHGGAPLFYPARDCGTSRGSRLRGRGHNRARGAPAAEEAKDHCLRTGRTAGEGDVLRQDASDAAGRHCPLHFNEPRTRDRRVAPPTERGFAAKPWTFCRVRQRRPTYSSPNRSPTPADRRYSPIAMATLDFLASWRSPPLFSAAPSLSDNDLSVSLFITTMLMRRLIGL